jgi:hypothetical protein
MPRLWQAVQRTKWWVPESHPVSVRCHRARCLLATALQAESTRSAGNVPSPRCDSYPRAIRSQLGADVRHRNRHRHQHRALDDCGSRRAGGRGARSNPHPHRRRTQPGEGVRAAHGATAEAHTAAAAGSTAAAGGRRNAEGTRQELQRRAGDDFEAGCITGLRGEIEPMSALDTINWQDVRTHYDERVRIHRELLTLRSDDNVKSSSLDYFWALATRRAITAPKSVHLVQRYSR